MNICENGVIRPMTPEEIAALKQAIAEAPEPEPDRIAELEARNQELTEFLEQMAEIYDGKEDTA